MARDICEKHPKKYFVRVVLQQILCKWQIHVLPTQNIRKKTNIKAEKKEKGEKKREQVSQTNRMTAL